jgi:predicted transcriptional regulator
MLVRDIVRLLDAEVIHGVDMDTREILSCCGSDMMSDVLAVVKDQPVLLTGLCNPQVVRTAEMMDIMCIVFVRGKRPDEKMIELAEERGINLMATYHTMFTSCGILYENGLVGGA